MIRKLVLLPGLDGTGELFARFERALPEELKPVIVSYPRDVFVAYAGLMSSVRSAVDGADSYVLMAESFSTPLAIQFAATNPPNMKGLILCAGFASSPVRGIFRFLCSFLAPIAFRVALPKAITKFLLVGPDASPVLVAEIQAAIKSVHPNVLSSRLQSVLTCNVLADLDQVTVPILYLQAKHDRLVPASCLEEIRQVEGETVFVALDGPHLLLQREPEQAADAVAAFLVQLR